MKKLACEMYTIVSSHLLKSRIQFYFEVTRCLEQNENTTSVHMIKPTQWLRIRSPVSNMF